MNTTPFFSPIFSTRCGRPWKVLTCSSNASRGKPTASHKATAAITLAALCRPCNGMSCVAIKSSLPCFRRPVSRSNQKSASCSNENHFTSRPARFMARQNTSSEFKTCTPSPRENLVLGMRIVEQVVVAVERSSEMFNTVAAVGRRLSMFSSWKLESSNTHTSAFLPSRCNSASKTGVPILPAMTVSSPHLMQR